MSKAMFGAGCFWGVEAAFKKLPGVLSTSVGYAGGHTENPSYEDVCTDKTGHAEVVLVEFDPGKISYGDFLQAFWECHNPTQLNRQGPDAGTQYRSVIFTFGEDQRKQAEQSKAVLVASGKFTRPIVTAIEPAPAFYRAEDYHQNYFEKQGVSHCPV